MYLEYGFTSALSTDDTKKSCLYTIILLLYGKMHLALLKLAKLYPSVFLKLLLQCTFESGIELNSVCLSPCIGYFYILVVLFNLVQILLLILKSILNWLAII